MRLTKDFHDDHVGPVEVFIIGAAIALPFSAVALAIWFAFTK